MFIVAQFYNGFLSLELDRVFLEMHSLHNEFQAYALSFNDDVHFYKKP